VIVCFELYLFLDNFLTSNVKHYQVLAATASSNATQPTAYVCQKYTCKMPVHSSDSLRDQLIQIMSKK
jgi:uncharacterized protein YyaL (SSP411 family)